MTASPQTAAPPAARPATQRRDWLWAALPYFVILLVALGLRLYQLSTLPPGLTHDEANHGREAIGILNGIYLYFFPLNYGSEPLYSYTVAAFMGVLGRNVFALRLVNVVFGVAAIALTAVWAAPRLGHSPAERRLTALLGAALMAVSFWPLASSREALRAGMLPFFMALAVWFFWRVLETRAPDGWPAGLTVRRGRLVWLVLGLALTIVATYHIYLAARVTWLLFPLYLAYLAVVFPAIFRRAWAPVLAGLGVAALLAVPMALYLRANPEMQTRLGMLDGPLEQITGGDWLPVLINARDALLAFVWPGFGDQFLAYNIPGRPVFDAVSAVFFVLGVGLCLWRWRSPLYAFLLLWLLVGIAPSLITGPTANTTRNLAALPAVYLLAAVGFAAPATWLAARLSPAAHRWGRLAITVAAVGWVAWAGWQSATDYFLRWGGSAEVRGAYQHTLVEALDYLAAAEVTGPLVFSSVTPGPAHDSSVALVVSGGDPAVTRARWTDARQALILPAAPDATLIIPDSTPPHPVLASLLTPADRVTLASDDLDPGFTRYQIDEAAVRALGRSAEPSGPPTDFNGAAELIGARWLEPNVGPGETAELLTVWRVLDPTHAGPLVPPSFTTDAVAFTHVLDGTGQVITQRDSLDAPSWAWQPGDLVLQIHPLTAPATAGTYSVVVGLYDRISGARLPVVDGGDTAAVPALIVHDGVNP
jgi:4-amino-4-deoxy-L-arabinose transferase-like glycosyltransferase